MTLRATEPHDLALPEKGLWVVEVWTIKEDYSSTSGSYQLFTGDAETWTVEVCTKLDSALRLSELHVESVRMRMNEWDGEAWKQVALWGSEKGLTLLGK